MEAEGLHGDLGYAVEFGLGDLKQAAGLVGQVELGDEVQAVGEGGEGVVDFVCDGGGKASGDGELLCAAESFLAFFFEG